MVALLEVVHQFEEMWDRSPQEAAKFAEEFIAESPEGYKLESYLIRADWLNETSRQYRRGRSYNDFRSWIAAKTAREAEIMRIVADDLRSAGYKIEYTASGIDNGGSIVFENRAVSQPDFFASINGVETYIEVKTRKDWRRIEFKIGELKSIVDSNALTVLVIGDEYCLVGANVMRQLLKGHRTKSEHHGKWIVDATAVAPFIFRCRALKNHTPEKPGV